MSSYQTDFHQHPINTWQKPQPQKFKPYQSYGDISSSYKTSFPGHQPQLLQKLLPRVKNQNKNIPFQANSQYKNQFPGKTTTLHKPQIKDRKYAPDRTKFEALTSYGSGFVNKRVNPHKKIQNPRYQFPDGYGFDGKTTYGKSFQQKKYERHKSYKPQQKLNPSSAIDFSSIYRDSYKWTQK